METVLKGVVAYIDVRSSFGNPAIAISKSLESLGACVSHSLSQLVTHVIFRNGSDVVRSWAVKRNIPIVSPAWVKASKMMKVKAPESTYTEKEDMSDVSGVFAEVNGEKNHDKQMTGKADLVVLDGKYDDRLPIFKPIRVSQKFIRPKTPPEMRNFLLRLQERQKVSNEDPIICDETVMKNSEENIESGAQCPSVKENTQDSRLESVLINPPITSTQNAINQLEVVEFCHSLSPIINNKHQGTDIIIEDSIINDSTIENDHATKSEQNKFKCRLINPNIESPVGELIIPQIKHSSHVFNQINKSQKRRRKSSIISNRHSFGTPLTPDVLLDFVASTHSSKSFNIRKHVQPVDGKLPSSIQKQQQQVVPKLLIHRKPSKLLSDLQKSPRIEISSMESILKETNYCGNNNNIPNEVDLKSSPFTCKTTPVCKQSNKPICRRQSKTKVITEKTEKNGRKTKPLLVSSSMPNENTNYSNNVSTKRKRKSTHVLFKKTKQPITILPPSNVDLDATVNDPYLQKSKSNSKQQAKPTQTSIGSSSIRGKIPNSTKELLPDIHGKRKLNTDDLMITSSLRTPKRLSMSQIKPISKRNSLEEFRTTPLSQRKGISIRSPLASEIGATRISIVFSGTQSEEEQVLIALLKSSNLIGYDIIKLPSSSLHSQLKKLKSKLGTSNRSCGLSQFTHLVTESPCRRTLKLFHALILGVHIVSTDWVRQSVAYNMWLSELEFKPPGLPRLSRMQKMNTFFSNVGIIYVGPDTKPPRQDLVDLLNLGGAVLTNKKTQAAILVGCIMLNKTCIKPSWILDSIFHAKLLPITDYQI
ncbi:Microcephalin isoform 1 [Schistosoma japonicum]|uniref:Microcephalin isoform 1 n=1 Tax=Schistosoma japonicum TaxID=6182 RepID=A0A4Z2D2J4_SCHJA|nr:Microcephalin isoform 1 [Schistosoma japonicum]